MACSYVSHDLGHIGNPSRHPVATSGPLGAVRQDPPRAMPGRNCAYSQNPAGSGRQVRRAAANSAITCAASSIRLPNCRGWSDRVAASRAHLAGRSRLALKARSARIHAHPRQPCRVAEVSNERRPRRLVGSGPRMAPARLQCSSPTEIGPPCCGKRRCRGPSRAAPLAYDGSWPTAASPSRNCDSSGRLASKLSSGRATFTAYSTPSSAARQSSFEAGCMPPTTTACSPTARPALLPPAAPVACPGPRSFGNRPIARRQPADDDQLLAGLRHGPGLAFPTPPDVPHL